MTRLHLGYAFVSKEHANEPHSQTVPFGWLGRPRRNGFGFRGSEAETSPVSRANRPAAPEKQAASAGIGAGSREANQQALRIATIFAAFVSIGLVILMGQGIIRGDW